MSPSLKNRPILCTHGDANHLGTHARVNLGAGEIGPNSKGIAFWLSRVHATFGPGKREFGARTVAAFLRPSWGRYGTELTKLVGQTSLSTLR